MGSIIMWFFTTDSALFFYQQGTFQSATTLRIKVLLKYAINIAGFCADLFSILIIKKY